MKKTCVKLMEWHYETEAMPEYVNAAAEMLIQCAWYCINNENTGVVKNADAALKRMIRKIIKSEKEHRNEYSLMALSYIYEKFFVK